jgi:hypothetical protein
LLVALARAELLREQGDAAGALRSLDALATEPWPAWIRKAAAVDLLAARLYTRAALDDLAGAESRRAEYEALPRRSPSPTRDLRLYRSLAQLYARRADWAAADAANRKAVQAAARLYAQFATPHEHTRFAQAQAGLLAEARECLERLGRSHEDQHLRDVFPAPEDVQRRQQELRRRRASRWQRLAVGLVLVNLAVLAGLTAFLRFPQEGAGVPPAFPIPVPAWNYVRQFVRGASDRFGPVGGMFLGCLLTYTASAVVVLLPSLLLGRLVPALRHRGGGAALFLAILPWLIGIGYFLFSRARSLPP